MNPLLVVPSRGVAVWATDLVTEKHCRQCLAAKVVNLVRGDRREAQPSCPTNVLMKGLTPFKWRSFWSGLAHPRLCERASMRRSISGTETLSGRSFNSRSLMIASAPRSFGALVTRRRMLAILSVARPALWAFGPAAILACGSIFLFDRRVDLSLPGRCRRGRNASGSDRDRSGRDRSCTECRNRFSGTQSANLCIHVSGGRGSEVAGEFVALAGLALSEELCRSPLKPWPVLAHARRLVLVSVQVILAALPERQFDAFALHLGVAQTVAAAGQWDFAGDLLATATQPLGADWIVAVAFVVAGEAGAKILNYSFFLIAAGITYGVCLSRFGRTPAAVATLILLSSPMAFMEAAGVALDNFQLLVITTVMALCGMWDKMPARDRVLSSAILIGGLPTAKLQAIFVQLAWLFFLLGQRHWLDVKRAGLRTSALAFFSLRLAPCRFSSRYFVTGNPLFPFFNGILKSPYFPPGNFASEMYPPYVMPDIFHKFTFYYLKIHRRMEWKFWFSIRRISPNSVVAPIICHSRFEAPNADQQRHSSGNQPAWRGDYRAH